MSCSGRSIIVTRPSPEGEELAHLFEAGGATVHRWPTIRIEFATAAELVRAHRAAAAADRIILTSRNALEAMAQDATSLREWPPAWTVGRATAAAAKRAGLDVAIVAEGGGRDELVRAILGEHDRLPCRAVWPCGDLADLAAFDELAAVGVVVEPRVVYRTRGALDERPSDFAKGLRADAAAFASPSSVTEFLAAISRLDSSIDTAAWAGARAAIVIGETTARAARGAGFRSVLIAEEPSSLAMVEIAEREL